MVAKFLNPNNPSWQRRPFALLNDGRKVWTAVLFFSAIMHRKVVHVFFSAIFAVTRLVEIQKFCHHLTMATWCNDFSLLPYKRQGVVVTVSRKYWPEDGIFVLGLARDCVVGEGGMGRWGERRRLSLPPSLESSPEIANSAFSPAKYKTIIYLRVWSSYQQIWRLTDTFSTCSLT